MILGRTGRAGAHAAIARAVDGRSEDAVLECDISTDHGSGKIRGVSIMGNEVIRSIFTKWMKPLHSLGMSHLFSTGMAHEAYSEVGMGVARSPL